MQKTYTPKKNEFTTSWYLVDANGRNLGRLSTQIASLLLGKHKPSFTPGIDIGDYVVVINAEHITVTGNKLDDKVYYHYTGYPSGLKEITLREQLTKHPERVIKRAVWGMLPHNKIGRKLLKKLKIYAGPDHPHSAQQPQSLEE